MIKTSAVRGNIFFEIVIIIAPDNVERKLKIVRDKLALINASRDADHQFGWAITETQITTKPLIVYLDDNTAKTVSQIFTIGPEETPMIFLDATGDYIGHVVYNKSNADASEAPVSYSICPDRLDENATGIAENFQQTSQTK